MSAYIGQMLWEEADQLNACINQTGVRKELGRSTKCLKIDMYNNTGDMTLYFYVKCFVLFCKAFTSIVNKEVAAGNKYCFKSFTQLCLKIYETDFGSFLECVDFPFLIHTNILVLSDNCMLLHICEALLQNRELVTFYTKQGFWYYCKDHTLS